VLVRRVRKAPEVWEEPRRVRWMERGEEG